MRTPKKITPCPIVEALVEIRFASSVPADAIFGIFYGRIRSRYPKVEQLPVLQLPDMLRSVDPNLRYQPHHKLVGEDYLIQIGPRVLSVAVHDYPGWESFSEEVLFVFSEIQKSDIISKLERCGIRYVNFFPQTNIYGNINISLQRGQEDLIGEDTHIRTIIRESDYYSILQIHNKAGIKAKKISGRGSLIDIDTLTDVGTEDFFQNAETIINKGHKIEKELFYSLLKEDFLLSLNPEY